MLKTNEKNIFSTGLAWEPIERPTANLSSEVLDPLIPGRTLTGSREGGSGPRSETGGADGEGSLGELRQRPIYNRENSIWEFPGGAVS